MPLFSYFRHVLWFQTSAQSHTIKQQCSCIQINSALVSESITHSAWLKFTITKTPPPARTVNDSAVYTHAMGSIPITRDLAFKENNPQYSGIHTK